MNSIPSTRKAKVKAARRLRTQQKIERQLNAIFRAGLCGLLHYGHRSERDALYAKARQILNE